MKKVISNYEVIDHGIEHAQFFQGCGTAYTEYDRVVTGCGQDAEEAWNDALEQMAMDEFDVSTLEASDDGKLYASDKAREASVEKACNGDVPEDCELYYYLSIRFNS